MKDHTSMNSYKRYTGLLNKACSGTLFLVLAALMSAFCVTSIINLIYTFSDGFLFVLIAFLSALFSVLATIGLWLMFFSAKKSSITARQIGLLCHLPRWRQVFRVILLIVVIVGVVMIAIAMLSIKITLESTADSAAQVLTEMEEMLAEFGLKSDDLAFIGDLLESVSFVFSAGLFLVILLGGVAATVLILIIVRYSKLCKLLSGAKKMYKSGKMRAPSTGFFVGSSYFFAVVLFIWNLGFLPLSSFSLSGFIYPAMMVVTAIIIKKNSMELNDIYREWQDEYAALK